VDKHLEKKPETLIKMRSGDKKDRKKIKIITQLAQARV
jgi:hypothetical protein